MGKWKLKSSLEEWEFVAGKIEEELFENGFSSKFITSIMLAMDETFANISMYAYGDGAGEVLIESICELSSTNRTAKIVFCDYGREFNPLKNYKEPDIDEKNSQNRKIGGLGIFLIKKQVDNVFYSYSNQSNNLTLIKTEII